MPKRKFVEPSSTESVIDIDEHLAALFERNPRATRPKFNKADFDAKKSVIFQAIDVKGVLDTSNKNWTHDLKGVPENLPPNRTGGVPIVHAYGVNEKGQSVCAHVHGYRPYIYMKQPAKYSPDIHNEPLKVVLDALIKNEGRGKACGNLGFHSCRFSKAGFQIPAPAKPAESLLSLLKSLLLLLKHLIFRRFQNYHFLIFYFEISGPELFKIIIFGLSHHFLDKTSPILI